MSYNLFINSADREYQSENICNFSVLNINDIYVNREKDLSLSQITIPNSIWAINNNNNTFEILYGTTQNNTITLKNGNYTDNAFCSELETKLDALSLGATFDCSIDTVNRLLSITASTGDFEITANERNYDYLGLDKNGSKSSNSSVWISDNVVELSGTRYIDFLLDLPLASNNNKNKNKNILARIWKNADSWGTIFYNNTQFNFVKLLTTSFNGLSIKLVDEWGDLINTNGKNWDCVIEVRLQDENNNYGRI